MEAEEANAADKEDVVVTADEAEEATEEEEVAEMHKEEEETAMPQFSEDQVRQDIERKEAILSYANEDSYFP